MQEPKPVSESDEFPGYYDDFCPRPNGPKVLCLCGSTKFKRQYEEATARFTMAGYLVFSCGIFGHADGISLTDDQKSMLDYLHKCKIDKSDIVFVVNVDGYIGESTRSEIDYATRMGRTVWYLEPSQKS